MSPVAVSEVRRASLGAGSQAEGLLAASFTVDLGAEGRLAASPAAGSRAERLLAAPPAAVSDGLLGAVSLSQPPFLLRPVPSCPRSCVPASAGLETCDGRLADVCSSDDLRAAADDLRSSSPVCCDGAQEASLAACDGLRAASGSSSAVRAVDQREGGTARAGGSRVWRAADALLLPSRGPSPAPWACSF